MKIKKIFIMLIFFLILSIDYTSSQNLEIESLPTLECGPYLDLLNFNLEIKEIQKKL